MKRLFRCSPAMSPLLAILAAAWLGACSSNAATPPTTRPSGTLAPTAGGLAAATATPDDPFADLPAEGRVASRRGDPRPAAYWALWNTCAPDNRSETAAANGGRAAGWFLLDDFIADPGIQLGDQPVATCAEGLALLQGRSLAGEDIADPVYVLASQLLTAELNLNAGAETCPIAEEAVVGGHILLAAAGFNGTGDYADRLSAELAASLPRFTQLLEGYNRGALCR